MDPIHSGPRDDIPDPAAVYRSAGEAGLRERLTQLDREALEATIRAHPPHHTAPPALDAMSEDELIGYIVDGAKRTAD